jgi:anti-sigma regulatory factor (Ser/Thr protein kinase)
LRGGRSAISGRLSPQGPEHAFRHDALLYSGEEQFLAGVLPFIHGALTAGDPIVVALDRAKIGLLRSELAADAGPVHFADMHELGANPARLIPAWRQFVEAHAAPGTRIWGVGEPVWAGRSEAELVECQLHESLLNVAFADAGPLSFLCPYDTAGLGQDVIAEALRSHAAVVQDGSRRASDSFCGAAAEAGPFGAPLPEPRGPVRVQAFGAGDLAAVRRLVARRARTAGLSVSRADDLVLAVNEVASNSIRHAGGTGTLRIWSDGDALLCEVRDRGRLDDPLAGRKRPDFAEIGGQGLWITNQVCDLVQLRSFPEGSAVRIHMHTR